jgi:catechol 2,3-dioxygenase-like lactoylglutathione lyase family enzyme
MDVSQPFAAETGVAKIVPPTKLAHFVLRTSRYADLVGWYKTVLGAHAVFENEFLTFLSYDEEHHRVAIIDAKNLGAQQEGVVGVHHIAFTYQNLAQLLGNYETLKELGILPVYSINHGPTTSLYYEDLDKNQLEFQVENYATVEESSNFFFSPAFAENPIGVEFDPDHLLRRLRAGEPEEALKSRPNDGARDLSDVKLR